MIAAMSRQADIGCGETKTGLFSTNIRPKNSASQREILNLEGVMTSVTEKKSSRLRSLLESSSLEFLMEAHNGISARVVEEAGFKGIWASGLALSAQFGVRDNNEASWTQIVDMLEFMSDVTTIPILLDGDTGYGNFNNMRRLVRKLEQREVGGVCIEDKLFPKTNSFINGERQPLCEVDEFCGKIKAGKDSQNDSDFCIVARVEALIAGWGMDEALRRAEAYHEAGADAILIHSKRRRADEVLEFAKHWGRRSPLVIVPTKYYSTPTPVFRKAGISVVIWANHMIRASVAHMTAVAKEVMATETLVNIEDKVIPVNEVFRLQGADELAQAECQYLVAKQANTSAVILAASRGQNMDTVTLYRPKVMLPVAGRSLLRRLVDEFKRQHVNQITVVAGYKAEAIAEGDGVGGIDVVENPRHMETGELASLACARHAIGHDTVITYGDLVFRSYILRDLLETNAELVVIVDSMMSLKGQGNFRDLAYCSRPDDHAVFPEDVTLRRITDATTPGMEEPSGRWVGMMRVQGTGRDWLIEAVDQLNDRDDFDKLGMPDLINHLVEAGHNIKVLYIHGHWLDVNSLVDLSRASDFTHGKLESFIEHD